NHSAYATFQQLVELSARRRTVKPHGEEPRERGIGQRLHRPQSSTSPTPSGSARRTDPAGPRRTALETRLLQRRSDVGPHRIQTVDLLLGSLLVGLRLGGAALGGSGRGGGRRVGGR